MECSIHRSARFFLLCALLLVAATWDAPCCFGIENAGPPTPTASLPTGPQSVRSGGMVEQSYNYHRQLPGQPAAAVGPGSARGGGWYHYGFPVESYRWGYFGAERNYPRIIWHAGWYGDCVRTAYRYGR